MALPPGVPPTIACVECGGRAHVLTILEADDELEAGDVIAYRCEDCNDRFDVVLSDDDIEGDGGGEGRGGT